jgi:lipopolysaccharide/colanic/teichoic acid biosynthesis glycosyltransferase
MPLSRGRDIVVATLIGAATAPIWLAAAIAINRSMGRPILFQQQRPGLNGEPFTLIKFRTMTAANPGQGTESDMLRLTPIGRFLRATSIDELPTLWNVIRGDMSLVGPRPLLMAYLDRYTTEQMRRHEVRPGITGWAQVNGRNSLTWEEKFALDVWYVDNRSFALDAHILWMTIKNVLTREGISADDHATMPEFMGTVGRNASNRY